MPLYELPDTIVPDSGVSLDTLKSAMPGDVLLAASVVRTAELVLDGEVSAKIDRFETSLSAGDRLLPMVVPAESAVLIGAGSAVFCGRQVESRSKLKNALIGNWFSKFDASVRFCFADSDGDRRLDRVFLGGSFDKEYQSGQVIDPVAYHVETLRRDQPGDSIWIKYERHRKGKVTLFIKYRREGVEFFANGYNTPEHYGKNSYPFFREVNTVKQPLPADVGDWIGSQLSVDSVAPDGRITYRVKSNFTATMFKPVSYQVYTLYVYY